MVLQLFNTRTRKKEAFKPLKSTVKFYSCGPTVYNFAHIGNLRAYIFNDTLKRTLIYDGFKVNHVMNYTDVGHLTSDQDEGEDKMEKGAAREGKTVWEIAEFYIDAFNKDAAKLNIIPPTTSCRATEHIKQQVDMIKKLEHNGLTYKTSTGVYFDTTQFSDYGKMAKLKLESLESGARIDVDKEKRHPRDFLLWAFCVGKNKNHIMHWDSPWGDGFPGWHIECSAMASHYLGEQFDIHTGGIDHIPVHHTNEIAQSEGAFGKKPWVNFWLHSEFLKFGEGKMAKSGETFITLKTIEDKGYPPLAYRYYCLNTHYRMALTFSYEALDAAKTALLSLQNRILDLKEKKDSKGFIDKFKEEFIEAVSDDLNTPKALGIMWTMLKSDDLGSKEKLKLLLDFDQVFGLNLDKIKKGEIDEEIEGLIEERERARKSKDFATSDKIRKILDQKGIILEDTREGVKWKRK